MIVEILIVNVAVVVPAALLAVIVTAKVPPARGVPEMTPVEVLSVRPAGRPVALKLVGVLLAAIAKLKAEPKTPLAPVLEMIGGWAEPSTVSVMSLPVPPT